MAEAPDRSAWSLAAIVMVGSLLLAARPLWTPAVPEGLIVEVVGQVARPGLYVVHPPTLAMAVELAGGKADGLPETPLEEGDGVRVTGAGAEVVSAAERAVADAPAVPEAPPRVWINRATAEELQVLPGVGPALAQRIVEDRAARGPFASVDALDRVRGVGPALVKKVSPLVEVAP